ncbi:hypothetical protein NQ315_009720 [Exocentrus adspersus]|uniref:Uncharacterized protein n=1 Tax=Exocentrus adspersus TaxID=1586481 RepID=A0AAV8WH68_9CUCU|nr:hypothetical protein NQ315_009720 [Exocentrus adspersus]
MALSGIFRRRKRGVTEGPKTNSLAGVPPPTPLNKAKLTAGTVAGPLIKKDKRHSSSRFNITKNRELEVLPSLRGRYLNE